MMDQAQQASATQGIAQLTTAGHGRAGQAQAAKGGLFAALLAIFSARHDARDKFGLMGKQAGKQFGASLDNLDHAFAKQGATASALASKMQRPSAKEAGLHAAGLAKGQKEHARDHVNHGGHERAEPSAIAAFALHPATPQQSTDMARQKDSHAVPAGARHHARPFAAANPTPEHLHAERTGSTLDSAETMQAKSSAGLGANARDAIQAGRADAREAEALDALGRREAAQEAAHEAAIRHAATTTRGAEPRGVEQLRPEQPRKIASEMQTKPAQARPAAADVVMSGLPSASEESIQAAMAALDARGGGKAGMNAAAESPATSGLPHANPAQAAHADTAQVNTRPQPSASAHPAGALHAPGQAPDATALNNRPDATPAFDHRMQGRHPLQAAQQSASGSPATAHATPTVASSMPDASAAAPISGGHGQTPTVQATVQSAPATDAATQAAQMPNTHAGPSRMFGPMRAFEAVQQIAHSAAQGHARLDIQLEPAHLGKLHVSLQTNAARQLVVHIAAEQPAAQQAIQQHLPQLRLALENQGMNPGEFSLSAGMGGDGQMPGQGNQSFGNPSSPRHSTPSASPATAPTVERAPDAAKASPGGRLSIHV